MEVQIMVRYRYSAYTTQTLRGCRASSTGSARWAAERFGEKYFGPAFDKVLFVQDDGIDGSIWKVRGDDKHYAWCWATGLIETGPEIPEHGATSSIVFASGPKRALEEVLGALARHPHKKGELLVPGVPEAKTQGEKVDALAKWVEWAALRNGKPHVHGVVFSREQEKL